MLPGVGIGEIMVVLVIALVVLGPKRLPETARSVGRGLREFKEAVASNMDRDDDDDQRPEVEASTSAPKAEVDNRRPAATT